MKNKIENELIRNLKLTKSDFGQKIKNFIYENEKTQYSISLFGVLSKHNPIKFDKEYAFEIINSTIDDSENPYYDEYNGIYFSLNNVEEIENGENFSFLNELDSILNKNYTIFWQNDEFINQYLNLKQFNCFEDVIVNKDQRDKFIRTRNNSVYNISGWSNYFDNLFKLNFSEYELIQNKSKTIFIKPLINGFSFGIEFNKKLFEAELKKGRLTFPELKVKLFLYNDSFLNIADLNDPFLGVLNLSTYKAKETLLQVSENSFKSINETIEEQIDNEKIRFYNEESFGEKLIKFAFFEAKIRSKIESFYLNYIELSVNETLKNL